MDSSAITVLVTAELDRSLLSTLPSVFKISFAGYGLNREMLSPAELKEKCRDIDVLVSEFDMITEEVMKTSRMKTIICCRAAVSTVVDLDAAKRLGICVHNNVGRNKVATADFTLSLIFDLLRNITLTDRMIHSSRIRELQHPMPVEYGDALWGLDDKSPYQLFRGPSMSEITIGIIGFGHVGQVLASKLEKLDIKYLVNTRHPGKDCRFVDLDTLLRESDVVSLHVSGNDSRIPIITLEQLKKMKRTAYLINTSRGYLVNEDDLYYALKNEMIAGAAIDVSMKEPMSEDDKLLELQNLIITPHIAGSSDDTITYGTKLVIDRLNELLHNLPVREG